jgi:hypothetical protein
MSYSILYTIYYAIYTIVDHIIFDLLKNEAPAHTFFGGIAIIRETAANHITNIKGA